MRKQWTIRWTVTILAGASALAGTLVPHYVTPNQCLCFITTLFWLWED